MAIRTGIVLCATLLCTLASEASFLTRLLEFLLSLRPSILITATPGFANLIATAASSTFYPDSARGHLRSSQEERHSEARSMLHRCDRERQQRQQGHNKTRQN